MQNTVCVIKSSYLIKSAYLWVKTIPDYEKLSWKAGPASAFVILDQSVRVISLSEEISGKEIEKSRYTIYTAWLTTAMMLNSDLCVCNCMAFNKKLMQLYKYQGL